VSRRRGAEEECRQCGSARLRSRGRIPRGRFFAGQALEPVWCGGTLYECRDCALSFRSPIESDEVYESLYAAAGATVYSANALRIDQQLAVRAIARRYDGGSVLDVGCFDGALLAALGPRFEKFGVEASRAAAEACRRRGVEVLAHSIRQLAEIERRFDVVCAIDVIEHVANPLRFLAGLARLVRPGGSILISTGNADAHAWRLFGGRYWYCSFPEHISFVSATWAAAAAEELGLDVVAMERFGHREVGATLSHALLGFARRLVVSTGEYLLSPLLADYRRLGPRFVLGFPGVVEDHMLIVFGSLKPHARRSGELQR